MRAARTSLAKTGTRYVYTRGTVVYKMVVAVIKKQLFWGGVRQNINQPSPKKHAC